MSCSSEQARIDAPRSVWAAEVPRVDAYCVRTVYNDTLTSDRLGEPSEAVRARVGTQAPFGACFWADELLSRRVAERSAAGVEVYGVWDPLGTSCRL